MDRRLCWTAGVGSCAALALLWLAIAGPVGAAEPPAAGGGTGGGGGAARDLKRGAEALAVENVTVTPATQPGAARVRARLQATGKPGLTPIARVAQNARLEGEQLTADVPLDVAPLARD